MKKVLFAAVTLTLAGLANADETPTTFNANDYIACDAYAMGAVLIAKKAADQKRPVEAIVNETYERPPVLDIKLSLLASDAIKTGYLQSAGETSLQRFLAGVCYGGDLTGRELAPKKP
ncbi:hypothetical protein [Paraburkholderia sp. Ac-20347]|uniref:hypothetical protein n=1 Tax=Paraburkholderia sp. Ac-20347 TaxID=2703892 RepID=UPI00197EF58B|nr:hypothetical protein [Paraburkholderia sp. Ac-20347]MBN3813427.1 hypothetical protein [Paraburkholderia sp. Ac-20347]